MCCLRYEHDFYVQSRKRFPKEGKIVNTRLGEEKVVSIDIFHESVTLRGVEGDMRVLPLVEFRTETEQAGGDTVIAVAEDDELAQDTIQPDEISPDLLYTAEHQIPPRNNVVPGPPATSTANPVGGDRDNDSSSKRRRGRRGGRRGRGGDESPPGNS
jgi:hypothetical protein